MRRSRRAQTTSCASRSMPSSSSRARTTCSNFARGRSICGSQRAAVFPRDHRSAHQSEESAAISSKSWNWKSSGAAAMAGSASSRSSTWTGSSPSTIPTARHWRQGAEGFGANAARKNCAPSIWSARIGGEEFAIQFPETSKADALQVCRRLLARIRGATVMADTKEIGFTCSIGLTEVALGGDMADAVLKRADQALYRAKELGRDRCEAASSRVERTAPVSPGGTTSIIGEAAEARQARKGGSIASAPRFRLRPIRIFQVQPMNAERTAERGESEIRITLEQRTERISDSRPH